MKKLIFTLLISALITGVAAAQGGERRGNGERRGGGGQMMEMLKEKIKTDFKLSSENADSVVSIQMHYQRDARMLERNQDMDEAKKKEKLSELNAGKTARLKTILDDKQIKKLEEFLENMRNSMRAQRQAAQQGMENK